ncbi:MAG: fibronectin type III domain-containing protein, partial [Dehalococcoidales bacterium]
ISRETTDPTKAPPRAPSQLVATATSSTQIDLSWSDNSKIEVGYRIERATNNAFTEDWKTFTVGPNVTTYSDTSASPATTYFYSVFAFDPAGDSRPTNTAEVTTP